jgi:hypothetical protein
VSQKYIKEQNQIRGAMMRQMRMLAIFTMLATSIGFCQDSIKNPKTLDESNADNAVRVIMSRPDGMYSSWDEKSLQKYGDASAVALTKYLGEKKPNETEFYLCLVIIRASFGYPKGIINEQDRNPSTALFVLKRLEGLRLSPEQIKEIAEIRHNLLAIPR